MKKLLLSLLASTIYTSTVSAQTCQQPPSCESLGYTKSVDDCGDIEYLTCPFDSSKVYCSGGSGDGDTIELLFNITGSQSAQFTYGGGGIEVDCGNGKTVSGTTSGTGTVTCSWTSSGEYTVKLTGDFNYYGGSSIYPKQLIKLNKKDVYTMRNVCDASTVGTFPKLPSTLVDGTNLFHNCSGLTVNGYELPLGLHTADGMFYNADGLSGEIKLPPSLLNVSNMFSKAGGSFSIVGLENTRIEEARGMFSSSGITSVSGLPDTIWNAPYMFYECENLTAMPNLPIALSHADEMFYQCRNMTGTFNDLNQIPTYATDMFYRCSKLTGSVECCDEDCRSVYDDALSGSGVSLICEE